MDAINDNAGAKRALQTLEEEGCDRLVILTNLFFYCGGTEEELRVGLKDALNFRDRLERLSTRLVEDAKGVETVLENCRMYGVADIHGFDDLSPTLRRLGTLMATLGKVMRDRLKNVRLGGAKRTRSKGGAKGRVNLVAGRTHHLVYLANYVKGLSERPAAKHYELLARLVAAVQNDERPLPTIADSLRKGVAAFVKSRPDDASYMAGLAADDFEEKNPQP